MAFWKWQRATLARCQSRMTRRLEHATIDRWLAYVSELRRARSIASWALRMMMIRRLGQGFQRLLKQSRAVEDEARNIAARRERLLKRERALAAIARWRGGVCERKRGW